MKFIAISLFISIFINHSFAFAESNFKLATIRNVQLEYIDIGSGDINIVIESGVGMGVNYWQPLLPMLKNLKQRIFIYSRAGNGNSSAVLDVSIKQSNMRLRTLLELLNIRKNIVLVGHSYGGLHVREYEKSHQKQVIGLVLLDPSHEQFEKKLVELDKSWAEKDNKKLNLILAKSQEWKILQSVYQKGQLSDNGYITKTPTVIVTSSKLGESDWWIGHSAEGKKIWRNLHYSLIRNNPNSVHIVSSKTGHNIPIDAPILVNKAINQVVELANGL
jgi:pimeloyl-ACP methyl ester carboxylesterase